jgi:hypothetical protein
MRPAPAAALHRRAGLIVAGSLRRPAAVQGPKPGADQFHELRHRFTAIYFGGVQQRNQALLALTHQGRQRQIPDTKLLRQFVAVQEAEGSASVATNAFHSGRMRPLLE